MKSQSQSNGGTRKARRTLHTMGILLLAIVGFGLISVPAGAQRDYTSCGHFETRENAQAALDENPALATTLDSDGNGIACEELQTGGPVVDPVSCGFFESQEGAQEALQDNPELALTLDANDNGVACDESFPDVVVDPTSCGHFETQEDVQVALDEGSVPNPENLDGDGDGIACEDAFGEQDEPVVEETTVVRLPSTGVGDTADRPDHGSLAKALLTLGAIAAAVGLRSRFGQSPA
ncbi:MAG: excalibur calcium-binding domain-containing protein [Chloroflexota bacterium]|nr:excalibur calcium-binding domain-containing protein [Chloroflexota bacterium]